MKGSALWSRVCVVLGSLGMLLGTIDPLEGSLLILPGSGLVALGTFLKKDQRAVFWFWLWVFVLIAVGVGAMFVLSAFGGIGGKTGHSMWWGVLILPYPIGWLMALGCAITVLFRRIKRSFA